VGLLLKEEAHDANRIELAYALYENDQDGKQSALRRHLRQLGFERRPSPEDGTDLPIYFIGVWDTVAALGLPGRMARLSAPFTEFHQTGLPANVSYARHALALHELREKFPALLWHGARNPDGHGRPRIQQVWFPGAHSNVGGGYSVKQWANAALDWMAGEAQSFGLLIRSWPRTPAEPCPRALIENSLSGPFAAGTPAIRASLLDPLSIDADTLNTFDVHPFAAQRLYDDRQTTYSFASHINDAMRTADWCTARMIHVLNADGRADAAMDDDHGAVRAWFSATTPPTNNHDVLLRAFMRSQFETGFKRKRIAAELSTLVHEVIGQLRDTPDLTPAKAFAEALVRLAGGVRDLTGERKLNAAAPLDEFLHVVEQLGISLRNSATAEGLRRTMPSKHALRPRPREPDDPDPPVE
jgi:hypothetical protein